jgi:hypothetical protein
VTDPRFDRVIETALSRVQTAVSNTIDKVRAQMAPLALSATSNLQRQVLMSAERELQLKSPALLKAFGEQFRSQALKHNRPAAADKPGPSAETDWASLSLVDNAEVERGVSADRLAQTLTQACDAELAALQSYIAALQDDASPDRNALRPQAVARALLGALADQSFADDVVQALSQHLGRILGPELAACYKLVVQDMHGQGVKPQGLSVAKSRLGISGHGGISSHSSLGSGGPSSLNSELHTQPAGFADSFGARLHGGSQHGQINADAHMRAAQALSEMFGVSMPGAPLEGPAPMGLRSWSVPGSGTGSGTGTSGSAQHAANADFQNLLRQIAMAAPPADWAAAFPAGAGNSPASYGNHTGNGSTQASGYGPASPHQDGFAGPLMAVNLIRAHRDELVRASGGAPLDQMVIDIVAALFDQVLSDPKVSPQMARQIARLQMPVLRVALGDMGFFNSRKHPVRRFVNRVATLSASFDDYTEGPGCACLARITALVNDIVDGDFDRMELYESKLAELEAFIDGENARDTAENAAVAAMLSGKEADLRVQQRYMQILKRELTDVEMPDFVREFLAQIWSQVQVMASARDGAQSPFALRMKTAGHELVLSVQPKGTPQLRKGFLLKLPQLMKDLNEGLGLIQWSEEAKQRFFSQLLPAHAECLKAAPQHDLTVRLLEQRLNTVEQIAIPSREEAANDPLPSVLDNIKEAPVLTVVSALSAEEIKTAGFVPEAMLASEGALDINLDLSGPSDPTLGEIDINLDTPPPPTAGLQLVHHINKGAAYQMLMQGEWKKVRLTWISDGRTFFIFTHGHTHKQTISLTARTLAKMCEGGRFKAFEQAELIERATVRARRQLAALSAGQSAGHSAGQTAAQTAAPARSAA